jgi:2-polyprenyl-6-hydroxyphenyl methylase / 3-demethylubiquinone-9 3-methyltransferase
MGASLSLPTSACHAGIVRSLTKATLATPKRPANDVAQYDDLAGEWWRPDGLFAMLHWIAVARARLVPPAARTGAVLVDLGCGAGLLAPHLSTKGYRHVGVDLAFSALEQAAAHGVAAVRASADAVPLAAGCADVVTVGELLEHVTEPRAVLAEAIRLLRPGGTLVIDTINKTLLARIIAVEIGERLHGVAPSGIHDPNLFVPPRVVIQECAKHGIEMKVRGLRPRVGQLVRFLATGRGDVAMVPVWTTAVLYQGVGRRSAST